MVLESFITELINKYFGFYLEKLDASQISLGILKGNISLRNIEIKPDLFNDFEIPLQLCYARINKLDMKIPFKAFYSEPITIEISGVYVLLQSKKANFYNEEKERKWLLNEKLKSLEMIEENKIIMATNNQNENNKNWSEQESFKDRFLFQILQNMYISICDIHIRFEKHDIYSDPFNIGFTLKQFTLEKNASQNEGQEAFSYSKLANLNCISLYWNTDDANDKRFAKLTKDEIGLKMAATIPDENKIAKKKALHQFLLEPLSATLRLNICKPTKISPAFSFPQISIQLFIDEFAIVILQEQLNSLRNFVCSLEQSVTKGRYRKFRPNHSVMNNAKPWWKYCYNVIVTCIVRPKRKMWSWENMKKHRTLCNKYCGLWALKLLHEGLRPDQLRSIEMLEEELDLLNILLCRKIVELKFGDMNLSQKPQHFSWLSMFLKRKWKTLSSKTIPSENTSCSIADFSKEMKEKLREAIGFTNNDRQVKSKSVKQKARTTLTANDIVIPRDYINFEVNCAIKVFSIKLIQDCERSLYVLQCNIRKIEVNFGQICWSPTIKIILRTRSISLFGNKSNSESSSEDREDIIKTLTLTKDENLIHRKELINVIIDITPMAKYDCRIQVEVQPMQLSYESMPLTKLIEFLSPLNYNDFHQLTPIICSSLNDLKGSPIVYWSDLDQKTCRLSLNIDVYYISLLVPQSGRKKGSGKKLILSIKHANFSTNHKASSTLLKVSSYSNEQMPIEKYENFIINIDSMQVFLLDSDVNWRRLMFECVDSPNHIVRPLSLEIQLQKCSFDENSRFPRFVISGIVPKISLDISDHMITLLFPLFTSLSIPTVNDRQGVLANIISLTSKYCAKIRSTKEDCGKSKIVKKSDFEANILITKFLLRIFKKTKMDKNGTLVGNIHIENATVDIIFDSYKKIIKGGLNSLNFEIPFYSDVNGMPLSLLQLEENETKSTKFQLSIDTETNNRLQLENVTNLLSLQLSIVKACIHKEGILYIIHFFHDALYRLHGATPPHSTFSEEQTSSKTNSFTANERSFHSNSLGTTDLLDRTLSFESKFLETPQTPVEIKSVADRDVVSPSQRWKRFSKFFRKSNTSSKKISPSAISNQSNQLFSPPPPSQQQPNESSTNNEDELLLNSNNLFTRPPSPPLPSTPPPPPLAAVAASSSTSSNFPVPTIAGTTNKKFPSDDGKSSSSSRRKFYSKKKKEENEKMGLNKQKGYENLSFKISKLNRNKKVIFFDSSSEPLQLKMNLSVTTIQVTFCTTNDSLCELIINGSSFEIKAGKKTIELNYTLSKIEVIDFDSETLFPQLFWFDDKENNEIAFDLNLIIFRTHTWQKENLKLNLSKYDLILNLQLLKIRLIFINKFLNHLTIFMNSFQQSLKNYQNQLDFLRSFLRKLHKKVVLIPVSSSNENSLEDNINFDEEINLTGNDERYKLNIYLKDPCIYCPQNTQSRNGLMIGFSEVFISNHFSTYPDEKLAIMDQLQLQLLKLQVYLGSFASAAVNVLLLKKNEIPKPQFQPVSVIIGRSNEINNNLDFHLTFIRNLSFEWYKSAAAGELYLTIKLLDIFVSQNDNRIALQTLLENFSETTIDNISTTDASENKSSSKPMPERKAHFSDVIDDRNKSTTDVIIIFNQAFKAMELSVTVHTLAIHLFKGETPLGLQDEVIPDSRNLACFTAKNIVVNGIFKTDESSLINISIGDADMMDTRPSAAISVAGATVLRTEKENKEYFVSMKFTQDKNGNTKINAEVSSLYICTSMENCLAIIEFFIKGTPEPPRKKRIKPDRQIKRKFNITKQKTNIVPNRDKTFRLKATVAKLKMVLLANSREVNSNALIIVLNVTCNVAMLTAIDKISARVDKFQVFTSTFKSLNDISKYGEVCAPVFVSFDCAITLQGKITGKIFIDRILLTVTPAIVQTLSNMFSTFSITTDTLEENHIADADELVIVPDNFWQPRPFALEEIPMIYIKSLQMARGMWHREGEQGIDIAVLLEEAEEIRDQQGFRGELALELSEIRLILESQINDKCVPMFVIDSSLYGDLRNPTTDVGLAVKIEVSASFYNEQVNEWEPIIEFYPEQDDRRWSFLVEINSFDDSFVFEEEEWKELTSLRPSKQCIYIESNDNLEITLSTSSIEVLGVLGRSFENAFEKTHDDKVNTDALYNVKNFTGEIIQIKLPFKLIAFDKIADENGFIDVFDKETLALSDDYRRSRRSILQKSHDIRCESDRKCILFMRLFQPRFLQKHLIISKRKGAEQSTKMKDVHSVTIYRNEKLAYFIQEMEDAAKVYIISTVTAFLGTRTVEFRSNVWIKNITKRKLNVSYERNHANDIVPLFVIEPEERISLPLCVVYGKSKSIFITGVGEFVSSKYKKVSWINLDKKESQIISFRDVKYTVYCLVCVEEEEVPLCDEEEELIPIYTMNIMYPSSFHNQLVVPLKITTPSGDMIIEPGNCVSLDSVCVDGTIIYILFFWSNENYFSNLVLSAKTNEFSTLEFVSANEHLQMDIGVHFKKDLGHHAYTFYSHYWLLNKTGLSVSYKTSDDRYFEQGAQITEAFMFGFRKRLLQLPNHLYLRVVNSEWSDKIPLDNVGSAGSIKCKCRKGRVYEIRVTVQLSKNCLTKIVTFMPHFLFLNKTPLKLVCQEELSIAAWICLIPGEVTAFWPEQIDLKTLSLRCGIFDLDKVDVNNLSEKIVQYLSALDSGLLACHVTHFFPIYGSHSTFLQLNSKFGGLFVEVQTTDDVTLVTFSSYQEGMSPVRIINYLENSSIFYFQKGSHLTHELKPHHSVYFAWDNPKCKHELKWRASAEKNKNKNFSNSLIMDGIGEFEVEGRHAYWVSIVIDMQRILFLTDNCDLAKYIHMQEEADRVDVEYHISLSSIGLSLIQSSVGQEICYISLSSSDVQWYLCSGGRNQHLRPFPTEQNQEIEFNYLTFLKSNQQDPIVRINTLHASLQVDLQRLRLLQPEIGDIRRIYRPAVWFQAELNPSGLSFFLKIYHLQIDSHLTDSVYAVVFSPFVQNDGNANEGQLSHLLQTSLFLSYTKIPGVYRFKYLEVLFQEVQLKIDNGFIRALLNFFSSSVTSLSETAAFEKDINEVASPLLANPVVTTAMESGLRSHIDYLFISSIKVHMSFSLTGNQNVDNSDIVNLVLNSVGIVATNVQDVVLKLAQFEKQNRIISLSKLQSDITRHYLSQIIRQLYVLVFGLDVIGNPLGVLRGFTKGFEDLFYEPIRGAAIGPTEMTAGMTRGVVSLMNHTVGGVAGGVSRITGALGKGIAALTLDSEFQKKRRLKLGLLGLSKRQRLAQGGHGFVAGVVSGVTGLVTQPYIGAKKSGPAGFAKGVGKGLMGVFTRPVGGVLDMTTYGLNALRESLETTAVVHRIRPPRYIQKNKIVNCYDRLKAEGNCVFQMMEKGSYINEREIYDSHVVTRNGKNVVLLTNNHLIYAAHNEFSDGWSTKWAVPFSDILDKPIITNKGLLIRTNEPNSKKLHNERYLDLDCVTAAYLSETLLAKKIEQRSLSVSQD